MPIAFLTHPRNDRDGPAAADRTDPDGDWSQYALGLCRGGAGLVQLPALILMGLPFPVALATHKLASVALGIGASGRHLQSSTLVTPSLR